MGFWIIALTAGFVVVAFMGRSMLSGGRAEADSASDLDIYRDQLGELDRDVARGTLAADEAERARVEISRRLLEADRKAQAAPGAARAPRAVTWSVLALSGALVIGGAAWVYSDIGAPGYFDMPLKERIAASQQALDDRISQDEAEARLPPWPGPPADAPADYIDLVSRLREAVAKRPDDLQGESLLATHEAQLGNYRAARRALGRVITIKGDDATADDYGQLADLMVLSAAGYVSPEAEQAIDAALSRDAQNPVARYYTGLLYAQVGRPDVAFRVWRDLLESSDPTEPWVKPIRSQIGQLAALAGVDYTPPAAAPGLPGPSADDMAAAADMTPQERAAMVDSMVQRLMDRLASDGGTAADWARLIQVLGVQGNKDKAAEIWAEARQTFAAHPDALATVAAAARDAGLDVGDAATAAPAPPADTALPGPTADDVNAAAEMSPEDRARMIDNMVTRLADRIGTEGGTPQEWAQLITAYGAMGETDLAKGAWANAERAHGDDAAAMAVIRPAAVAAGVTE